MCVMILVDKTWILMLVILYFSFYQGCLVKIYIKNLFGSIQRVNVLLNSKKNDVISN